MLFADSVCCYIPKQMESDCHGRLLIFIRENDMDILQPVKVLPQHKSLFFGHQPNLENSGENELVKQKLSVSI